MFHRNWFIRCFVDGEKCLNCGFCSTVNVCKSPGKCIGCLSCFWACPNEARKLVVDGRKLVETVKVKVNGRLEVVPEAITVKEALESLDYNVPWLEEESLCMTGGCWNCMVLIDGKPERSCITPVKKGMTIETNVTDIPPLRIIHGPEGHPVGGKATPWWIKSKWGYVEVAVWTAGCNLRCPQCQNFHVTYDNVSQPITPFKAAKKVSLARRKYRVNRMAISGGEPTLNRNWLIDFFKYLKGFNRDEKARFHLDSNGTLLTLNYIDELINVGVTDIGVEPKGVTVETFMKITGLKNRGLVKEYIKTQWAAIKHIVDNYRDRVFLGVGLPYNKALIPLEEVRLFGEKISKIDREIQVCVLDYFPAFRRRDIKRPDFKEMKGVKKILEEAGLKTVICQTVKGYIGP